MFVLAAVFVGEVLHQLRLALGGLCALFEPWQDLVVHGRAALRSQHPIDRGLDHVEHQRRLTTGHQLGNFFVRPLLVVIERLVGRHFVTVGPLTFQFAQVMAHQCRMALNVALFVKDVAALALRLLNGLAVLRFHHPKIIVTRRAALAP